MKANYFLCCIFLLFVKTFSQEIIFEDNFEKDNYGLASDEDGFKITFKEGAMILANNNEKSTKWQLITLNKNLENIDFDAEAHISLVQSQFGVSSYGFVWACNKNYTNYHVVNLNGDRENESYWYRDKSKKYDLNWTPNKNCLGKGKGENKIKISKRAQNVTIYLNDKIIAKTNNTFSYGDNFGFLLDPQTTIKVTKLKVTKFPLSINVVPNFDPKLKIEELPNFISTYDIDEKNPVISPDGKTLYFVRRGASPKNGGSKNKVWYAEFKNNRWTSPQNSGKPINNESHNFVISVSPDNNSLLLNGLYHANGTYAGEGISLSTRAANGWNVPKEQKIKGYFNKNKFVGFFLANDNKHLLMAVEREKGYGKLDLFISFLEAEGQWSVPVNLGNTINTEQNEGNPFLASDGKTLYFASDGHPGYGGLDLFVCKRLDDSWTNWSSPKNLGNIINTTDDDFSIYLTAKGDKAYLSRNNDLYEFANIIEQDPVTLVKGKVFDAKTNQIISAEIVYNDLKTNKELGKAITDPKTGEYAIVLPYGGKYSFMAKKEGYYAVTQNVNLYNLDQYKEIAIDLYLSPIEKGQTIRLNNIFFESGKYELLPESNAELEKLFKILVDNAQLTIEISGHTDAIGEEQDNLILSTHRANAVMKYLLARGIQKGRLTAKGYGETKFIATNETEEGKQQNRRVEFSILKI